MSVAVEIPNQASSKQAPVAHRRIHLQRVPSIAKFTQDAGPAPPRHHLTIHIVLKIQNAEWLEQKLKEVSDPTSANYGKYATIEQINAKTAAPEEEVAKVIKWLEENGVMDATARSNDVSVSATVSQVEKLFKTELHKFVIPNDKDNTFVVRHVTPLQVPEHLQSIVVFVAGV